MGAIWRAFTFEPRFRDGQQRDRLISICKNLSIFFHTWRCNSSNICSSCSSFTEEEEELQESYKPEEVNLGHPRVAQAHAPICRPILGCHVNTVYCYIHSDILSVFKYGIVISAIESGERTINNYTIYCSTQFARWPCTSTLLVPFFLLIS